MRVKAAQFLSNGDSCGICPCWRRPEPRIRCRDGPRSGFRRRAALQQPLVHRRRRIRHGLVRCFCNSKHVTVVFPTIVIKFPLVACLDLFIQSQRSAPDPQFSRYRAASAWNQLHALFFFLCWTFKLSFRCALTDRDKFTQNLTSVRALLIMSWWFII